MNAFHRLWQKLSQQNSWQQQQEAPSYWKSYQLAMREAQASSTQFQDIRFVVIDTETTGLDHRADHVVSFGALRVSNNDIELSTLADWRIRTALPSSQPSIEVHGLLNDELEGGLSEKRFVEKLVGYISNDVIVGYRPGFDLAILNRLVADHTGGRISNPTLDVYQLGMRVDYPLKPGFVNPEPYRFDSLCRRFDIEVTDRHTALGDAYATALLLMKLLERLRQNGLSTLKDLTRAYG